MREISHVVTLTHPVKDVAVQDYLEVWLASRGKYFKRLYVLNSKSGKFDKELGPFEIIHVGDVVDLENDDPEPQPEEKGEEGKKKKKK